MIKIVVMRITVSAGKNKRKAKASNATKEEKKLKEPPSTHITIIYLSQYLHLHHSFLLVH